MNSHALNRQGREKVSGELLRRGAIEVNAFGTRRIGLQASSSDHSRTIKIRIKTKKKGFFEGSCGADSKNGFWPAKSALSEIIIIKNQLVID